MGRVVIATGLAVLLAVLAAPAWAGSPAPLSRETTVAPTGAPCEAPARVYGSARTMPTVGPKPWRFEVAVYLWASSISGTQYDRGTPSDIDIAFGDLFDKLDYAFQGYVEVGYKRFSFAVDATFLKLEQPGPRVLTRLPTTRSLEEALIDLRLGYTVLCRRIGSDRWGCCCYPRHYTLDAIVGARYWNLEAALEGDVPAGAVGVQNLSSTISWWDPYVGVRARWPFAKRWFFNLYGDVGGFDIGDASELTWQIQACLGFRITRTFALLLGYRVLDVDRVTGSGSDKEGIDATYHGPFLGIGLAF